MGVQIDSIEQDGIGDLPARLLAGNLYAQVLHAPGGLEVHEHALLHLGGNIGQRHAHSVFRRVEVGLVRIVGELDLHRDQLGRLVWIEGEPDVAHLGVEVPKLHDMIDICEHIGPVVALSQREPIGQIDGAVSRRGEVVHVEDEHLERKRRQHDERHSPRHPHKGATVDEHEMLEGVGYVLAHGGHRPII